MIRGVHQIGISVADLDGSVRGYGSAAGLAEVARWKDPATGAQCALMKGVNGYLELGCYPGSSDQTPEHPPVNEAGITHFCVQGGSIDDVIQGLQGDGFSFPDRPVDLKTGFLYAYGRSGEGSVVEVEGAPFARAQPASWIGHVAYATHDLERLAGFYGKLLGAPVQYSPRLRNNADYDRVTGLTDVDVLAAWVRGANIALEFWQYLNPETTARTSDRAREAPGYAHVGFEVEELEAGVAQALDLGARQVEPARQVGPWRESLVRDPDGNLIKLIEWAVEANGCRLADLSAPDILAAVAADFDLHLKAAADAKS